MLNLILFSLFLTPLLFNIWLLSNILILLILIIILFFSNDLVILSYNIYIDNISYGLIILTIWITFLIINSSPLYNYKNINLFLFIVLLLITLLILSLC